MQVDVAWMQVWFNRFNEQYFNKLLPRPRLALSGSRTRLGSMSCKKRIRLFRTELYDYSIHISNYYEQSERQFQNVLLHEMIHYYIAYKGIKDTSPHGKHFRDIANTFNTKYGWEISVSTRLKDVEIAEKVKKRRQRLILAIELNDGKRLLTVVNPRYAKQLAVQIKHQSTIKRHDWYVSDDDFFIQYPAVRSLRGRIIDTQTFDTLTSKMQQITL